MKISRRLFLIQSALVPAAFSAPGKLKVIIGGGHPGDPEYGCGGTAARFSDAGHDVVLLYLNQGEPNQAVRTAEARKACEILKARPAYAGQTDAKAIVDAAHYDAFRKIVEDEKPDVIVTQWPIDNHRDHRAISGLAYDAWLKLGKKSEFYYYEVSNGEDTQMFTPTHYVDITAVEPRKKAACYAHASQTPDRYYALQSEVARFRGLEGGYGQAEAFVRHAQSRGVLLPA
jgi:LmbE family N-acetylglucosaminyl deacetylase